MLAGPPCGCNVEIKPPLATVSVGRTCSGHFCSHLLGLCSCFRLTKTNSLFLASGGSQDKAALLGIVPTLFSPVLRAC